MSSNEDIGIPGSRYAYVSGVGVEKITRDSWLKTAFPEWGTWLNKRIENTKVGSKNFVIWWLGACGFFIKTQKANLLIDHYSGPSLYTSLEDGCGVCRQSGAKRIDWLRTFPHVIDPWAIKECDAVLITHFHPDHCDPYTIVPLSETTNAKFIGPKIVCSKLREYGVPEDRIIQLKWGESKKIRDTTIIATETADRTLLFSGKEPPKKMEDGAVCFLIKTPAGNIFHNGDSHYANLFYKIGLENTIDVALLQFGGNPVGVTDKMTSYDAYRVAEALRTKILIPMHYDWANMQGDPYELEWIVKHNAPWIKTVIMQSGTKFEYPKDINIRRVKYPNYVDRWRPKSSWEYGEEKRIF
ncbi:MBL fold metallo-hydrolase [[Eubacterium] cellulosolvens]